MVYRTPVPVPTQVRKTNLVPCKDVSSKARQNSAPRQRSIRRRALDHFHRHASRHSHGDHSRPPLRKTLSASLWPTLCRFRLTFTSTTNTPERRPTNPPPTQAAHSESMRHLLFRPTFPAHPPTTDNTRRSRIPFLASPRETITRRPPWGIDIGDGRRQPEPPADGAPHKPPHRLVLTHLESAMLIRTS